MLLRVMGVDDIDDIMPIEEENFTSPWRKVDYIHELENNPYALYYVLEDEGTIIGYVGTWISYDSSQITTIAIRKDRQGEGLSKKLLEQVISDMETSECENCTLEVRVSNVKAIGLYEKYGFKKAALRKDYYKDNHEDAYLMMKEREL